MTASPKLHRALDRAAVIGRACLNSRASLFFAGFALAAIGFSYAPVPPQPAVQGGSGTIQGTLPAGIVPAMPSMGTANSNNSMIAVTGMDLTGASVLYLVDTITHQIAVYQAMGGSEATQGIKLVAARRIDLDLQLYGFNDKSEYSFEELQKRFAENKRTVQPAREPAK